MGKTTEIPIWRARIVCSIPGDVKFPVQDNSYGKISQFIGSSCKICTTRSMLTPFMGPEIIRNESLRLFWFLILNPFAYWVILHVLCCLLTFFSKLTSFRKSYQSFKQFGSRSECQIVWIQIRPDILSGLIWVQIVCKGYQQTTIVGRVN